ncbi:hypothetical protein CBL_07926 [Carabus blaptoides fortunei]
MSPPLIGPLWKPMFDSSMKLMDARPKLTHHNYISSMRRIYSVLPISDQHETYKSKQRLETRLLCVGRSLFLLLALLVAVVPAGEDGSVTKRGCTRKGSREVNHSFLVNSHTEIYSYSNPFTPLLLLSQNIAIHISQHRRGYNWYILFKPEEDASETAVVVVRCGAVSVLLVRLSRREWTCPVNRMSGVQFFLSGEAGHRESPRLHQFACGKLGYPSQSHGTNHDTSEKIPAGFASD